MELSFTTVLQISFSCAFENVACIKFKYCDVIIDSDFQIERQREYI